MNRSKFKVSFQDGMFTNGHGVSVFDISISDENYGNENICTVIGNIYENPELLK